MQFEKIQELKKERKDLKAMYKDNLAQSDQYEEIVEKLKELRAKKKAIEAHVQNSMGRNYEKIEELDRQIKAEAEILSDLALNEYTEGKHVEVTDAFANKYAPQFTVKFRKDYTGKTV